MEPPSKGSAAPKGPIDGTCSTFGSLAKLVVEVRIGNVNHKGGLVKGILAIHCLEQQARAAPRCFDGAGTAHSASSKPWHGMVSLHCISGWRARHQIPVIEMEKAAYDTEFFKS